MGACLSSDVNGSSAMSPAEARALAAEQQKSKDLEASLQKVPRNSLLPFPLIQICPPRIPASPLLPTSLSLSFSFSLYLCIHILILFHLYFRQFLPVCSSGSMRLILIFFFFSL